MTSTSNPLKAALLRGDLQVGLWCSLASALSTEVVAGSGADWLLIDTEHSPNDLRSVVAQLQALGAYDLEPMVRLADDDPVAVKRFMDGGARSLMLPNVNSADQARAIVAATRYPPHGMRGFSAAHRANRFGRIEGYHEAASTTVCIAVQIETPEAVSAAADIAAVDGIDALFVGPGDLSASLGAMGRPGDKPVQDAIAATVKAAREAGKAAGILAPAKADADRYIDWGCTLVAVGSDLGLLARSADTLIASFGDRR